MARATKKSAKKLGAKITKKSIKKKSKQLASEQEQDTTSVLHGSMQNTFREAFLKRP